MKDSHQRTITEKNSKPRCPLCGVSMDIRRSRSTCQVCGLGLDHFGTVEPDLMDSRGIRLQLGALVIMISLVAAQVLVYGILLLAALDLSGLIWLFIAFPTGTLAASFVEILRKRNANHVDKLPPCFPAVTFLGSGVVLLFLVFWKLYSREDAEHAGKILLFFVLGAVFSATGVWIFDTRLKLERNHLLKMGSGLLAGFSAFSFLSGAFLLREDIFRGVMAFSGGILALLVAWYLNRAAWKAAWEKEQGGEKA